MSAIVVAFDGIIADTIVLRASAIVAAAKAEGWHIDAESLTNVLPGRTIDEVVLLSAPAISAHELSAQVLATDDHPSIEHATLVDYTLVDIVTLRAQRSVADRMAQGIEMLPDIRTWIHEQRNRSTRVILRADSLRRDVEPILRQMEMEWAFTVVRCADDQPRAVKMSSLHNSYAAISRRLDALRESTERQAREASVYAMSTAQSYLGFADPLT